MKNNKEFVVKFDFKRIDEGTVYLGLLHRYMEGTYKLIYSYGLQLYDMDGKISNNIYRPAYKKVLQKIICKVPMIIINPDHRSDMVPIHFIKLSDLLPSTWVANYSGMSCHGKPVYVVYPKYF